MDEHRNGPVRVIVVGGGVSGCACAATLADAGVEVMVINSALDTVGLPAYGPDIVGGEDGWDAVGRVLAALPDVLREVWLDAAMVPVGTSVGTPGPCCAAETSAVGVVSPVLLNVDRRMLSIETKRALEKIAGLTFRQGLIQGMRVDRPGAVQEESPDSWAAPRPSAAVAVETVFGEILEADALVIAVGLSMGGQVTVGRGRLPGGRYGEMPSDGLRETLERMGVEFEEVTLDVGGRIARSDEGFVRLMASLRGQDAWRETEAAGDDDGAVTPGPAPSGVRLRVAGLLPARSVLEGVIEAASAASPGPSGWGRGAAGSGDGAVDEGADRSADGRASPAANAFAVEADGKDATLRGADATLRDAPADGPWSLGFPPAPHWDRSLRMDRILLGHGLWEDGAPVFSPDGAATAEVYRGGRHEHGGLGSEGGGEIGSPDEFLATRLCHTVCGLAVRSVAADGRLLAGGLPVGAVWVSGRAGGAADYLESLESGVRVAESVVAHLRGLRGTAERDSGRGCDEESHTREGYGGPVSDCGIVANPPERCE